MDWTVLAASVATGLLSIGAVSIFVAKYMPAVSKWSMLAKDAVETLADIADSLKDGNLTPEEVVKLKADVIKFQVDLKG